MRLADLASILAQGCTLWTDSFKLSGTPARSGGFRFYKKAADFFQNLRQGWITEKGAALCDNTLFLCDIWFLYRAPLSAALKNIDFTGFPHVFLWQRS